MKTVLKDNVFCAELQNSLFFFQPKQRLSYKVIHSHNSKKNFITLVTQAVCIR